MAGGDGTAVLNLGADSANVRKAFGSVVGEARKTNAQLLAVDRKAAADKSKIEEKAASDYQKFLNQEWRDAIKYANNKVKEAERAEKEKTKAVETESRKRLRIIDAEVRSDQRAAEKTVSDRERAEQRITAITAREVRTRAANQRRVAGEMIRGAVGGVARGIAGGVTETIANIQDARQRRAATDRVLNNAMFQAGGTRATSAIEVAQVHAFALEHRLDSAEVAEGINAAQVNFNSLGRGVDSSMTPEARATRRRQNLTGLLESARLARNTGQDATQVMRVQGLLQMSGMDEGMQRQTLLGMTGMAQQGAVLLSDITRAGLGPIQRRIAQVTSGAAPADRGRLAQGAIYQTMAEMEAMAAMGVGARRTGNVSADLATALTGNVTQAKMLHNLRAAHNTAAEHVLFERDATGTGSHLRSIYAGGTLQLTRGMIAAFGDNTNAMANVFAGGGHGNAQGLQRNWRTQLGLMQGAGGAQTERLLNGAVNGTDFNEQRVAEGEDLFKNDMASKLTHEREQRDTELLGENNHELQALNTTIQDFNSRMPLVASIANHIGGSAGVVAAAHIFDPSQRDRDMLQYRIQAHASEGLSGREETARTSQLMAANDASLYAKDGGSKATGGHAQSAAQTAAIIAAIMQAAPQVRLTVTPHDAVQALTSATQRPGGGPGVM